MNLYFDNAATTQISEEALEAMTNVLRVDYANPSSLHRQGIDAERHLKEAKLFFSQELKTNEKEIYFTSGGTESNNLAIQGVAHANQRSGKHLITTSIEHPSVGHVMDHLEEEGFEVTRLHVDSLGRVDIKELSAAIREDTTLVSIMQVNNELGTIQNIEAIGKCIKESNSKTYFHVDGVQGFMKFPVNLKKSRVDLYSASGHKIFGPKGVGLLVVRQQVKIQPLLFGGQQQNEIRPGTENLPGIVGFLAAAKVYKQHSKMIYENLCMLKKNFIKHLEEELPTWQLNSGMSNGDYENEEFSPYILNLRTASLKGEVLLHGLEDYGIAVSTGSACSSKKLTVSSVLKAIGLSDIESDRCIRISMSKNQDQESLEVLIKALQELDQMFGKFVKK